MTPITDRSQAVEPGFAQVREALVKFRGKVVDYEWGKWGGQLVDPDTGIAKEPREFFDINCVDVEVLETKEELNMDISQKYNFRINCSKYKGSFWIDQFLASADEHKVLIPDGLVGKVITWLKVTQEADDPKYNATGFIIADVGDASPTPTSEEPVSTKLPIDILYDLAVGKTEKELESAIETHPELVKSPMFPMVKSGIFLKSLLGEGRLVLVDGKFQLPG